MRTEGSFGLAPMSRTWPRICPAAFCDRAEPRCTPIPQKIVAAVFGVYRSTGSLRRISNPIPCSNFVLVFLDILRKSVGENPLFLSCQYRVQGTCNAAAALTLVDVILLHMDPPFILAVLKMSPRQAEGQENGIWENF